MTVLKTSFRYDASIIESEFQIDLYKTDRLRLIQIYNLTPFMLLKLDTLLKHQS